MIRPDAPLSGSPSSGAVTFLRAGRILADAGGSAGGACELGIGADGRIASITPIDPAALTAEERDRLLVPALADAHDHGRGLRTLACGTPDLPLETWLPELARQPRVDPYRMAAVAFARLAESGVACVNHCHNTQDSRALLAEAEAVSRAARDVGIAVAFAWPFFDRNAYAYGPLEALLGDLPPKMREAVAARAGSLRPAEENFALFEQARQFEHALFQLHYHPVAPQWVQHDTLQRIAQASAETGRRVHIHLLETRAQREWADAHYPDGLIAFLDGIGLLSPRLTIAHAVWLRPEECALLAARGVIVSVNPSSNLRLRSGCPPVSAMAAAGLAFGIGLDGMSLDDDEDMLREMRLLKIGLEPGIAADPEADAVLALAAGWQIGRRSIVGEDGGGRLRVGAPADVLALDYAAFSRDVIDDELPLRHLLLGRAQRRHVTHLYVAGRPIVVEGRCCGVDRAAFEAALVAEARAVRLTSPPDTAEIATLREAVSAFYRAGHHRHGNAV